MRQAFLSWLSIFLGNNVKRTSASHPDLPAPKPHCLSSPSPPFPLGRSLSRRSAESAPFGEGRQQRAGGRGRGSHTLDVLPFHTRAAPAPARRCRRSADKRFRWSVGTEEEEVEKAKGWRGFAAAEEGEQTRSAILLLPPTIRSDVVRNFSHWTHGTSYPRH